jgi:hypothetical protein
VTQAKPIDVTMELQHRFVTKVRVADDGCWIWLGSRSDAGYGILWSGERRLRAHRFAYTAVVGPIPEGLDLDHLCRVRHCVNPAHLEPVTRGENARRGEAPTIKVWRSGRCERGHELSPIRDGRHNMCRTCRNERRRKPPREPITPEILEARRERQRQYMRAWHIRKKAERAAG